MAEKQYPKPHQRKMRVRPEDLIEIIAGNDKGLRGRVLDIDLKRGRVTVEGLNLAKKHQGQTQRSGQAVQAGIIEFEAPVDVSNVMVVCPNCDEPSRMGIRREDKLRIRVCKKCGEDVD